MRECALACERTWVPMSVRVCVRVCVRACVGECVRGCVRKSVDAWMRTSVLPCERKCVNTR